MQKISNKKNNRYDALELLNNKYNFFSLNEWEKLEDVIAKNPWLLLESWEKMGDYKFTSSAEKKQTLIILVVELCRLNKLYDNNILPYNLKWYIEIYNNTLSDLKKNEKYSQDVDLENKVTQLFSDFMFLASYQFEWTISWYDINTMKEFWHRIYSYIKQRLDGKVFTTTEVINSQKVVDDKFLPQQVSVDKETIDNILLEVKQLWILMDNGYTIDQITNDLMSRWETPYSWISLKLPSYLGYLQDKIRKVDLKQDNQFLIIDIITKILSNKSEFWDLRTGELSEMIKMTTKYIERYKNAELLKQKYNIEWNKFNAEQKKTIYKITTSSA